MVTVQMKIIFKPALEGDLHRSRIQAYAKIEYVSVRCIFRRIKYAYDTFRLYANLNSAIDLSEM